MILGFHVVDDDDDDDDDTHLDIPIPRPNACGKKHVVRLGSLLGQ